MTDARLALLVAVALSALTALADSFVKKAAELGRVESGYMVLAAIIFGGSAFGWYFTLRHVNLATLGGVYCLTTILMLAISGTVFFGEKLSFADLFVIFMSLMAIAVFWREL